MYINNTKKKINKYAQLFTADIEFKTNVDLKNQ